MEESLNNAAESNNHFNNWRRYLPSSSVLWILGFAAFVAPAAVPSMDQYRLMDSKFVMWSFLSAIYLFYFFRPFVASLLVCVGRSAEPSAKEDKTPPQPTTAALDALPTESQPNAATYDVENAGTEAIKEESSEDTPPKKKKRVYFLDNVKSFLTVIVIIFHVNIVYGGGARGWEFIVGGFDNSFAKALTIFFNDPSQAYFMSLFFFISAYFVPRSFAKKGRAVFLQERAHRVLFPALVVTLILEPLVTIISAQVAGYTHPYRPHSAQTAWFLWWLLLFNLWYAFTAVNEQEGVPAKKTKLPLSKYCQRLPAFVYRWLAGILICGIGQWAVNNYVFHGSGLFANMPLTQGSFTCDLLFFYLGLLAAENEWFSQELSLREQLGMDVWMFRLLVLVEYVAIVLLGYNPAGVDISPTLCTFIQSIVYGIFCVDMSVAVLEFFQTNFNFRNEFTKWLAEAAYGAYLLQIITITLAVVVFSCSYNGIPPLSFDAYNGFSYISYTTIPIPTLAAAWLSSVLTVVPLTWLFAWALKKLPVFKNIL